MKRVLSLVLALVMLLAMFTVVGAAASPDPTQAPAEPTEVPADPAEVPAEPAADPADAPAEDPVEPAPQADTPEEPAEPTEKPAEPTAEPAEPSPEATETVTEPAPAADEVPADETTPEPAAAPTEEPAEPTAAPAAENSAEPSALPTEIPEQPTPTPDHRSVKLHANGGYFTGDHAGYDGFSKALVGDNLPKTGSEGKGDPGWYTPERAGYKFLGWYESKAKAEAHGQAGLDEGDPVPEGVTDLWAGWEKLPRTVTLDATPGYIKHNEVAEKLYKDWGGAADQSAGLDWNNGVTRINIALMADGKLPAEVASLEMEREGWTFKGWYTGKPSETKQPFEDGWKYVATPSGVKVEQGNDVPDGASTLYAYWEPNASLAGTTIITYKLNYNGFDGKTGALVCDRKSGSQFTVGDSIIYGFNIDSKAIEAQLDEAKDEDAKKAIIEKYWQDHDFNGYTFTGWYTAPVGGEKLEYGDTPKNGKTYYAQWTHEVIGTPQPSPTPAPINGMHIDARHLTIRQDPNKPESVTIPLFVTPVGGTGTITWTVKVPPTVDLEHLSAAFKGETQTYTIVGDKITKADDGITKEGPNFTAKAEGLNLTIFPQKGCSQVLFVSAACGDVTTPADATVVITHTPEEQETVTQAATCTAEGEAAILCAECGEATEVHTLPATGHTYEVASSRVLNGVRIYTEQCTAGDAEMEVKAGDTNGDGEVTLTDVNKLFNSVNGNPNAKVIKEAGDTNGDGEVSLTDVNKLFNYVNGTTSTLG